MTSKACFSNRTGFFRQLTAKQLWLFARWRVFLLFLYPLSGMMEYSSITARADLMNLQFSVDRSFLSRTYVVLFMMPVLAIVFPPASVTSTRGRSWIFIIRSRSRGCGCSSRIT